MDHVTTVSPSWNWLRVRRRVGGLSFLAFLVFWAMLLIKDRSRYLPELLDLTLAVMVAAGAAEGSAAAWKRRGASSHPGFWSAWAVVNLAGAVAITAYLAWRLWGLLAS
jgi:hypothetical protein